jgi:hypothetical protein
MVKKSDHSLTFPCGNHFMKFRSNKLSVSRDRCGKPKIKMASNMVKVSRSHDRSHTLIWNEIFYNVL